MCCMCAVQDIKFVLIPQPHTSEFTIWMSSQDRTTVSQLIGRIFFMLFRYPPGGSRVRKGWRHTNVPNNFQMCSFPHPWWPTAALVRLCTRVLCVRIRKFGPPYFEKIKVSDSLKFGNSLSFPFFPENGTFRDTYREIPNTRL